MQRSKVEIYVHYVWATYRRAPWVTPDLERAVYRCLAAETIKLKCEVLALNGMPDHVHLVVRQHSTVSPAWLMQTVKGASSNFVRDELGRGESFGWQDNYAALSVSRTHLDKVIAYVRRQKERHAAGRLWQELEKTEEDVP